MEIWLLPIHLFPPYVLLLKCWIFTCSLCERQNKSPKDEVPVFYYSKLPLLIVALLFSLSRACSHHDIVPSSSLRVSACLTLTGRVGCPWATSSEDWQPTTFSSQSLLLLATNSKQQEVEHFLICSNLISSAGIWSAPLSPVKVSHPTSLIIFSPLSRFF